MINSKANIDKPFSNYIFDEYDRIADLTEADYRQLRRFMDKIHGDSFTVQSFREAFGLFDAGFITIYNFICDEKNLEDLIALGELFVEYNSVKEPTK